MIKEFVSGKSYRYTKNTIPTGNWNIKYMGIVLDGKPRECVTGHSFWAEFKGLNYNNKPYKWDWHSGFENWEEVRQEMIISENGEFNMSVR